MSSENTVRTFEFTVAGAGPWVPASNSLLVQTDVGVSVEAVTLIGQSPEVLGTVAANDFDRYDTAHAFVRLVADGAGSAAISASIPTPAGAGGGSGTSDTTEATQLQVKTAVQSINTKTAALVAGRTPVDGSGVTQPVSAAALPLPDGAATESTLAAASAKLPTLVSGRMPVDPTGAVQTGTGAVTATTQRVTLATDGPGVANLSSIDGKLPASLGGKAAAASLSVTAATGTITSVGSTVAAGGTAQQLAAANTARRGLTVQNTSAGELRVNVFGTASASAGYRVMSGDLLVLDAPHCGVGAVSIWGATTGQAFVGGEAV